jgi:hypothetical protein
LIEGAVLYFLEGAPPLGALSWPLRRKKASRASFENMSSDKENAYFTDGVQTNLTNLARSTFKVISHTSVISTKTSHRQSAQIGKQSAWHVSKHAQRRANKVRVKRADNRPQRTRISGPRPKIAICRLFAIKAISQSIAEQLKANSRLTRRKPSSSRRTDMAAFDLYKRAKSRVLTAGFSDEQSQTCGRQLNFWMKR